jgi:hypothetical protein
MNVNRADMSGDRVIGRAQEQEQESYSLDALIRGGAHEAN